MNLRQWELLSRKNVSVGKWFPIEERTYRKRDGSVVDDFTVTTLADVSMVIPVTDEKKIVMVRQFKPGAGELTLEFPAGRLKEGEDYLAAAKTELMEETGMEARELVELGETVTFPTKASERIMNYLGLGAKIVSEQKLDVHEEIEVVEFDPQQVAERVINGEINTAPSIAAWHLELAKAEGSLFG